MKAPKAKKTADEKLAPRCLECAWCVPDDDLAVSQVCRVHGTAISPRSLWRRACADFQPLDPSSDQ